MNRLTQAQAAATRRLNADLLALSRERRTFLAQVRRMSWPVSHVPELWAAHADRFLADRRKETTA